MDNGNEIEKNVAAESGSHSSDLFSDRIGSSARVAKVKSSIQDFLEQESRNLPTEASGVKYDLAEEYAATKSNGMKNLFPVLLWMLAAFLFVGIMAVTIVSIVNRQNRKIEVEVESFDNLNLSNLLDLVSGTQSQINEESANKANLEAQREAVIEQAESARKSSLATLESMNLKDASERNGTLSFGTWPDVGEPNVPLIEQLKDLKNRGNKLILWTCRAGEPLENAVNWCRQHGLVFDAVNDNLPEIVSLYGNNSRKITCDYYIDDRACLPEDLKKMIA